MSKLDDILDQGSDREDGIEYRRLHKQQIKALFLELIGDPDKSDSPGRTNCILEFKQKVSEL